MTDYWIVLRDDEICNVVKDRKSAIKYLKLLINQTLKDIGNQEFCDEFDYFVIIPRYEIKRTKQRPVFLGL